MDLNLGRHAHFLNDDQMAFFVKSIDALSFGIPSLSIGMMFVTYSQLFPLLVEDFDAMYNLFLLFLILHCNPTSIIACSWIFLLPEPDLEKMHQIIAQMALFVQRQGVQSEFVLRVKQGDNPKFWFLSPGHHLHPYFRYLVDNTVVLVMISAGKLRADAGEGYDR